jgi:hypothetical protein
MRKEINILKMQFHIYFFVIRGIHFIYTNILWTHFNSNKYCKHKIYRKCVWNTYLLLNNYYSLLEQLTPNIGSKATNKQINGRNTYTNNNYHTQTNKKAVSQYNKCNQVPPVLSSKTRLIN